MYTELDVSQQSLSEFGINNDSQTSSLSLSNNNYRLNVNDKSKSLSMMNDPMSVVNNIDDDSVAQFPFDHNFGSSMNHYVDTKFTDLDEKISHEDPNKIELVNNLENEDQSDCIIQSSIESPDTTAYW